MTQQRTPSEIDPKAFRNALGQFATGVTIITARAPDGSDVGLTANSFSSVSLDPPLVLWSLARGANSMPVFQQTDHFAVHVLTVDQTELSRRFAARRSDKFDGIAIERGAGDVPILTDYAARFECRKTYAYEGGDHIIFVGEVLRFHQSERPPLLFHSGAYATKLPHTEAVAAPANSEASGTFTEDFLMYLLERCTPQATKPFHEATHELGLSITGMQILALLSVGDGRLLSDLEAIFSITDAAIHRVIDDLCNDDLARLADDQRVWISEGGKDTIIKLLAIGKALEADALQDIDPWQQRVFKECLKKIIRRTDPGLPSVFGTGARD